MHLRKKKWSDNFDSFPNYLKEENDILSFLQNNSFDLEIGSGKGDFIYQKSLDNPQTIFLAIEKSHNVLAYLLRDLYHKPLNNLYIINSHIEDLFTKIKDNTVQNIYLNFSDPWPKKRHNKNRLTADNKVNEYHRILKNEGHIYLKTDNISLFEEAQLHFTKPNFKIISCDNDYQLVLGDVLTEYEKRFRALNIKINRLVIKRT
ncbi:MAG: tRNA (guanosine(46)-N7)-methyltransferase TrmB [Bacillales bacterium]|jgi:tRNA (guanine-N7-)-methyltransferase|nr:tRNA (guanosine(46)-N7)-methyltransferase TrmB [Bacillales bacterium]